MAIIPTDIGSDEDLARRVLVRARVIAPCIDSFEDGSEEKKDAIAILKGVIAELPVPGQGRVKSMSRNGTSVTYAEIVSAFNGDAVAGLRALCPAVESSGGPVGYFPKASGVLARMWPEEYE